MKKLFISSLSLLLLLNSAEFGTVRVLAEENEPTETETDAETPAETEIPSELEAVEEETPVTQETPTEETPVTEETDPEIKEEGTEETPSEEEPAEKSGAISKRCTILLRKKRQIKEEMAYDPERIHG